MALKKSQKSLKKWAKQKWGTKSGKPSTQGKDATGERYLPKKARAAYQTRSTLLHQRRKEKTQRKESSTANNPKRLQRKQGVLANDG